ncbi:hypothetical protein SCA6_001725 [Theobroma cacao]
MLKTLFPFKTKRTKKRENEKFSVSRAGGKSNKRDKQPNHAWKSILRVSFFVPLLRLAILLCSLMSIRLFIERVYMAIVILCVKVLRKKRYTRYSLEAMKDVELNKSHPLLLVQIPMYNEKEVYKLSIGAACGLSWPSPRLIVQVLDVSTNEVLRELIEFECRKWIEKGVNVKYETRNNRNGYKAGALKEGTAGVWRIQAINDAGGWKDRTTVEDMDLAVRASTGNFSLWGTLQQVSQLDPVPALVTLDSKTATSHFHVLIPVYVHLTKPIAIYIPATISILNAVCTPSDYRTPGSKPCQRMGGDSKAREHWKAEEQHQDVEEIQISGWRRKDPRLGTRTGNIYAISCNLWKRPFFLVSVPASCGLLRAGIGIRGNVCIELKVKPRLPPQAAASCSLEC